MSGTDDLARLVLGIDESLTDEVLDAAECALIDHLGVGLYGSRLPAARIVAAYAVEEAAGAHGRIPLYGRPESLPAAVAARVNGTAAHSFELDDVLEMPGMHPGSVVVPAAFAAAVDRETSGRDLLAAIVIGYEAYSRVCLAAGSQKTPFHTTGTHGVFGSTAAAARLAGLDADQLSNAWGVAASFASGIKAFQNGGGEIKRLHPGLAAENGIVAVSLTERGLTGPRGVLEDDRGFFAAYGESIDLAWLLREQNFFWIQQVYYKQYASCGVTHSIVNATKKIAAINSLGPEDVTRVRVGTSARGVNQNSISSPAETMSVQYSIESAVALALLDLDDPTSFIYDAYSASPAVYLSQRVEVYIDPEIERVYPWRLAGHVEIELTDGRRLEADEPGLPDFSDPAVRRSVIEQKFRRLTQDLLSSADQDSLLSLIGELREGGPVTKIARLISSDRHVA